MLNNGPSGNLAQFKAIQQNFRFYKQEFLDIIKNQVTLV